MKYNCKFTEEELRLMSCGLKWLYNNENCRQYAKNVINGFREEHMKISDDSELFQEICELHGIIKGLIRNQKMEE